MILSFFLSVEEPFLSYAMFDWSILILIIPNYFLLGLSVYYFKNDIEFFIWGIVTFAIESLELSYIWISVYFKRFSDSSSIDFFIQL